MHEMPRHASRQSASSARPTSTCAQRGSRSERKIHIERVIAVKLPTTELIEGIRNDVIEARHFFDVYRVYKLKDTREKYPDAFRSFEPFIACDLRAHFAAMMVALGRIFDQN